MRYLISLLLLYTIVGRPLAQNYSEPPDLPNSIALVTAAETFTLSVGVNSYDGVLNTPVDVQDNYKLVVQTGMQIDSIRYTFVDGFGGYSGFMLFNTISAPPPPLTGIMAVPYPVGPGTYDAAAVANFAVNVLWQMDVYVSGPPPPCAMTMLNVNVGACMVANSTYDVNGDVQFSSAPSTGQLIIEDTASGMQDVYNTPFASPHAYSITGITANGQSSAIRAWFIADTVCSIEVGYTAPTACACNAHAGTSTVNFTGNINYMICDGDSFLITHDGNDTLPAGPSPEITYAIFTCPPDTTIDDPVLDTCYTGFVTGSISQYADANQGGMASTLPAFLIGQGEIITNNTIWFVPLTMTDIGMFIYDPTCVDMNDPIGVTYLDPTVYSHSIDTLSGTLTVTVSGGYPGVFPPGGGYSVTNNGSGTLSSTSVDSSGGSFQLSGLVSGSIVDYTVTDSNGCALGVMDTISGPVNVVEPMSPGDIQLYPNPMQRTTLFTLADLSNGEYTLEILDGTGRLVRLERFYTNPLVFDRENLPSGLYYFRIKASQREISSGKLMIH